MQPVGIACFTFTEGIPELTILSLVDQKIKAKDKIRNTKI